MAGLVVYKGFELLQRKIGVERAQKLLQVHGVYLAVTITCVCIHVGMCIEGCPCAYDDAGSSMSECVRVVWWRSIARIKLRYVHTRKGTHTRVYMYLKEKSSALTKDSR